MVFNKFAMDHSPQSGIYFFAFIQSIGVVLLIPVMAKTGFYTDKTYFVMNRRIVFAGGAVAIPWIAHMITKGYAFKLVDNPAYVSAIMLMAPLFIALFYRIIKHKETADVKSGYGVVISAIILVLLTMR